MQAPLHLAMLLTSSASKRTLYIEADNCAEFALFHCRQSSSSVRSQHQKYSVQFRNYVYWLPKMIFQNQTVLFFSSPDIPLKHLAGIIQQATYVKTNNNNYSLILSNLFYKNSTFSDIFPQTIDALEKIKSDEKRRNLSIMKTMNSPLVAKRNTDSTSKY